MSLNLIANTCCNCVTECVPLLKNAVIKGRFVTAKKAFHLQFMSQNELLYPKYLGCAASRRNFATTAHPKERKRKTKMVSQLENDLDIDPSQSETEKSSRLAARQKERELMKNYPFLSEKLRQVYVLDQDVAGEIVKAVRNNQADPNVPVLEANPGLGIVTRALLKSGVTRIVVAEALSKFVPYLSELSTKTVGTSLKILNWDHFSLYQRLADNDLPCAYKHFEDTMAEIIPHKDWDDGPPLTVLGVIPSNKDRMYMTHMVMSCARQYGLFMIGRPEWFLIVSPSFYKNILVLGLTRRTGHGIYFTHLGVTLGLVFDIQLCGQFPGWQFIPHFPEKRRVLAHQPFPSMSENMRYLIRLRARKEQIIPLTDIPIFYSFLSQILKCRKQRLIPKMEQLVPGCGIHLIVSGFSIMLPILDVSTDQFVFIFKAMQNWPEFEGSPMKAFLTDHRMPFMDDDHQDEKPGDKDS